MNIPLDFADCENALRFIPRLGIVQNDTFADICEKAGCEARTKSLKTGRKLARSVLHLIYSCRSIHLPAHKLDTTIKIE